MRGRMLELLAERSRSWQPPRVPVIGASTFGSMLLGQARRLPGLEIACVADLDVERARRALRTAGYPSREVETTDDAATALRCAAQPPVRDLARRRGRLHRGHTLVSSAVARERGLLPIELADGLLVTREVRLGEPVASTTSARPRQDPPSRAGSR